ncbi:MAG: hypothetical protein RMN51_11760 [Verrucomicrobiota bacterium]|nr:hypothetical protein [Limisphaera sp.]MDW8382765.1 hypothetical protein [Verrucomicrobiota bacterium]
MPPGASSSPERPFQLIRLAVASDIHYAGPIEQARGEDVDVRRIPNFFQREVLRLWRYLFWMRHPLANNALLTTFLVQARQQGCTHAVVNGDYAADTASMGLSDVGTRESARLCLEQLRAAFGSRLRLVLGDHELGKLSFFGHYGGLRLESWHRARQEFCLEPVWLWDLGAYRLVGVTSTLLALPVFQRDLLPNERSEWERLRHEHLTQVAQIFAETGAGQRLILFCHDPTALPFLATLPEVQAQLARLELTVIGHLHSPLILWKSRLLSGMPRLCRFGISVERMSTALQQARIWHNFRVRLCPSLAGIQLERGGGWVLLELDPSGQSPCHWHLFPLRRPREKARVGQAHVAGLQFPDSPGSSANKLV